MAGRGLRDYLLGKRAALAASAAARPNGASWRETVEARVIADDATGVRKLRIRDWQFISDSGAAFGGWGLGPSSPELLCGVLGTCITHTYEIGAARMGIPLDHIEVRVSAQNNDAAFLDIDTGDPPVPFAITVEVTLTADGVTQSGLDRLHAYVRERCPLTRLLREPQSVAFVVR